MATRSKTAKRYTVAQKRQIIKNWKQAKKNGMTFRAYCTRCKVAESTVRNWINNGVTGTRGTTRSTSSRRRSGSGTVTRRVTRTGTRRTTKSKGRVKAKSRRSTTRRTTVAKKSNVRGRKATTKGRTRRR